MWRILFGILLTGLAYSLAEIYLGLGSDVLLGVVFLLFYEMHREHEEIVDELDRIRTTQLISIYDGDSDETD